MPAPMAMPALAPIDEGLEFDGVNEGLGVDVWLAPAAVTGVMIDDADGADDGVEVVDIEAADVVE